MLIYAAAPLSLLEELPETDFPKSQSQGVCSIGVAWASLLLGKHQQSSYSTEVLG